MTVVRSVDGNWLNGSPSTKSPGDMCDGSRGSLDGTYKGLEFNHASYKNVQISSEVAISAPNEHRKWHFMDFTAASQRRPKWGPCGGNELPVTSFIGQKVLYVFNLCWRLKHVVYFMLLV